MSSFCSKPPTPWPPLPLSYIQKWSSSLTTGQVPRDKAVYCTSQELYHLQNVALLCSTDFHTPFYPPTWFWFFLRTPRHTKHTRTALWMSRATLASLPWSHSIDPRDSVISSARSLDHPDWIQVSPSLCAFQNNSQASSRTKQSKNVISWHPHHLPSYPNIPFALPFFFLPVPFPKLCGSPAPTWPFPAQRWLPTEERHTREKECIFMGGRPRRE